MNKQKLFINGVSIIVIISFIYSNVVWAQGSIGVHRGIAPIQLPVELGISINNLQIPENLGKVKELWHSGATKTVLHIQDSHANYEAQTNIAKILEHLLNNPMSPRAPTRGVGRRGKGEGVNTPPILIAIEGAKGGIDTRMFRRIPILEVRDMLADYFMEKGIINGVEYYDAMAGDKSFIVWGVEDKKTYIDNVKYFKKVQETKGPVQEYVKKRLNRLNDNVWTEEQKEFIDKYYKYQDDEIGLEEYAMYLSKVQKWGQSPFSYLTNLIKLKKHINFDRIEQERMDILKQLKEKMVQEEFVNLITEGLNYQVGNKAAVDYFLRLKELIKGYILTPWKLDSTGRREIDGSGGGGTTTKNFPFFTFFSI